MLVGKKVNLILILSSVYLQAYNTEGTLLGKATFDSSIVANQEIINPDKFKTVLKEFLTQIRILNNLALLIIDDNLIYAKKITFKDDKEKLDLEMKFYNEVPFNPENLARAQIPQQQSELLLATNKAIYHPIVDITHTLGGQIITVVPGFFIKNSGIQTLSQSDIANIKSNNQIISTGDVFTVYNKMSFNQAQSDSSKGQTFSINNLSQYKKLLFILMPVVMIITLVVLAIISGLLKPF